MSSASRSSTIARRDAGVARDLEVVAGGVPEGRPHEALERHRVGRGRPDRRAAAPDWRPARAQTRRRLRRAWAARPGREPVPQVARQLGDPEERSLRAAGRPATRRRAAAGRGRVTGRLGRSRRGSATSTWSASSRGRPRPGPGSGRPACIARARRSRSADSASLAGQIGLKLYHWSGPDRIALGERVGDRLGRPLELGRVGRGDHDRARPRTTREACRPAGGGSMTGRMRDPVFAASVAGPAGSVVQASNRRTGMPSLR